MEPSGAGDTARLGSLLIEQLSTRAEVRTVRFARNLPLAGNARIDLLWVLGLVSLRRSSARGGVLARHPTPLGPPLLPRG